MPTRTVPHTNSEHYPNVRHKRAAMLAALARSGTPLFLGERDNLVDRYRALARCLREAWRRHVIAYSFKTNYGVAEDGVLRDLGVWAEVVSGREYRLARSLGYPGSAIIFNGPYKPTEALRTAFEDGALVNVNDHDELDTIVDWSSRGTVPLEIGIRLSCALPRLGSSRFGFSMDHPEASEAVERITRAPNLKLVALHTHLYGDTDDASIYEEAATKLGAFAARHVPDYHTALKYVDVGGGFPAHSPKPKSRAAWAPQSIDTYVHTIARALRPFFPDQASAPILVVEPGRYLTDDGIVLVTRVSHVKVRDGKQFVTSNGSISMVPLTHYRPQIIRAYTSELHERSGAEASTIIYGSTCRENDVLYQGMFVEVELGDLLVHYAAGAYNSSLSPDFIFASPSLSMI